MDLKEAGDEGVVKVLRGCRQGVFNSRASESCMTLLTALLLDHD